VARSVRVQVPGGIYHITARGNRRQPIYSDDQDCMRFLRRLDRVASRRAWRCHAYCLMPNHYHLVLETVTDDISAGIQWLNGTYAQSFNHRHGVAGHLFQGRFHSVLVESNWHLLELSRYVVLNPVRGGLCAHAAEWKWSSYRAATGRASRPGFLSVDWLLSQFGRDPLQAREAFRLFVEDAAIWRNQASD
jgi:putative transposase